jgi:hypothetical protein
MIRQTHQKGYSCKPSTSAASCDAVSRITPSLIGGHRKAPCSSRFHNSNEHIEAMRRAFRRVCDILQLDSGREDPMTEIIVMRIVELAKLPWSRRRWVKQF